MFVVNLAKKPRKNILHFYLKLKKHIYICFVKQLNDNRLNPFMSLIWHDQTFT